MNKTLKESKEKKIQIVKNKTIMNKPLEDLNLQRESVKKTLIE